MNCKKIKLSSLEFPNTDGAHSNARILQTGGQKRKQRRRRRRRRMIEDELKPFKKSGQIL